MPHQSSPVVPALQASTPNTSNGRDPTDEAAYTSSTTSDHQDCKSIATTYDAYNDDMTRHLHSHIPDNQAPQSGKGYKKPTVEDFDEKKEQARVETDFAASKEDDLSEDEEDSDCESVSSTSSSDTTEDKPDEALSDADILYNGTLEEKAQTFLRHAPAGISPSLRALMEKIARGEIKLEDHQAPKGMINRLYAWMEKKLSGWWAKYLDSKTRMSWEENERHGEEFVKDWMAKAKKQGWELRSFEEQDEEEEKLLADLNGN
ncbi:hypothetical protein N0V85_006760 [Neurospora sp. IMI 360204]|nr:hypothetical protein N0V85_006760 [Neurospora sp. IMI 360204]